MADDPYAPAMATMDDIATVYAAMNVFWLLFNSIHIIAMQVHCICQERRKKVTPWLSDAVVVAWLKRKTLKN